MSQQDTLAAGANTAAMHADCGPIFRGMSRLFAWSPSSLQPLTSTNAGPQGPAFAARSYQHWVDQGLIEVFR
jgi:hypothetical protein